MRRLVDYMKEARTFYLATVDGDKPSIRPIGGKPVLDEIGFIQFEDKVYLYTDNRKPMFRQISANPSVAITFVVPSGFIRLTAKAVFDDNADAKKMMIDENKSLSSLYRADDDFFEVYYLKDVEAFLYAIGQDPLKLS